MIWTSTSTSWPALVGALPCTVDHRSKITREHPEWFQPLVKVVSWVYRKRKRMIRMIGSNRQTSTILWAAATPTCIST